MHTNDPYPTIADPVPLRLLEQEWPSLANGALRPALARWRQTEPAFRRIGNPAALLHALDTAGDWKAKDELLLALVRVARRDPLAARVVLQTLLPGLKRAAGRLLFDAAEREEVWELLLAGCWEQIRTYPLERRPRRVAANILLDTVHRTLAERSRNRRQQMELTDADEPVATGGHGADVEAPLRRAVVAGAISEAEAELILTTRVDGQSLAQLAEECGLGYQALLMRRIRAEKRLWLFLGIAGVSSRGSDRPVSAARVSGAHTGQAGAINTHRRR
jgi:DNA-directed RNA polymerase specialized sigma24 family protein